MFHDVCWANGMKGLAIDPRQIAEWTWDQLLLVVSDRKHLMHSNPNLVTMSAQEAYARGFVKMEQGGSLNQQLQRKAVEKQRS